MHRNDGHDGGASNHYNVISMGSALLQESALGSYNLMLWQSLLMYILVATVNRMMTNGVFQLHSNEISRNYGSTCRAHSAIGNICFCIQSVLQDR